MDKRMRQNLILTAFGITLFAAVMNLDSVFLLLQKIVGMILPLLFGFTFAFVLAVPMNGFEKIIKKVCGKAKHKPREKAVHIISLILTLSSILVIAILIGTIAVPQIIDSVKSIGVMIKEKWPEWAAI